MLENKIEDSQFLIIGIDNSITLLEKIISLFVEKCFFENEYEIIIMINSHYELLQIDDLINLESKFYNFSFNKHEDEGVVYYEYYKSIITVYINESEFIYANPNVLFVHQENNNIPLRTFILSDDINDIFEHVIISTNDYPDSLYYQVKSEFKTLHIQNKNITKIFNE